MQKTINEIIFPENWPMYKLSLVGIIVADMDKAIDFYQSLGIGPFTNLMEMVTVTERKIGDRDAMDIENRCELAKLGDLTFELVQPIKGDTFEREGLDNKGDHGGLLGFNVENLDKSIEEFTKRGFEIIETARFAEGGGFAFINGTKGGMKIIEIIDWPTDKLKKQLT